MDSCTIIQTSSPDPILIVGNKLSRVCPAGITGESVLMELLDAVIDRAADILERIGSEVDQISHVIFEPEGEMTRSQREILRGIGRKGEKPVPPLNMIGDFDHCFSAHFKSGQHRKRRLR